MYFIGSNIEKIINLLLIKSQMAGKIIGEFNTQQY
jgi:hypothetical protein